MMAVQGEDGMIPESIKREHLLHAIADIRAGGVPKIRGPTKFNLLHDGRSYAPNIALPLASKYATDEEDYPWYANKVLRRRGIAE